MLGFEHIALSLSLSTYLSLYLSPREIRANLRFQKSGDTEKIESYQEMKIAILVHGSEVEVFANAVFTGLGCKPDTQAECYHKLPTRGIKLDC